MSYNVEPNARRRAQSSAPEIDLRLPRGRGPDDEPAASLAESRDA